MEDRKLKLDGSTLRSLRPAKEFNKQKVKNAEITSVDFSDDGEFLLTACSGDRHMHIYDCTSGEHKSKIPSMKYGCGIARFSHSSKNCIHTSSVGANNSEDDHKIRYLSMHDVKYIRYFTGHTSEVTALEVSPSDDKFISAAKDNTVRMWNLNKSASIGKMELPSPCFVAFDSTGMVFAVACRPTKTVSLYDANHFTAGPFKTFPVHCNDEVSWSHIEFSNNGKYILLATDSFCHYVFDAFEGTVMHRLVGHEPLPKRGDSRTGIYQACFSTDGNHVLAGSGSNQVALWDLAQARYPELRPLELIQTHKTAQLIAFNPKLFLIVTADTGVLLWISEF